MLIGAQQIALNRLRLNGGEGVLDRHGKVVTRGERLTGIDPVTWLRLMLTGYAEMRDDLRIGITAKGEAALADMPGPKVHQDTIHGSSFQSPARHPGAE